MKKIIHAFIIALVYPASVIYGQLTIEECQKKAQENYPLVKQYGLIEKSKEFNLSNANKGYLPQLSLSAKMTYQSQVTEIPVVLPNITIDGVRKDQYQAALELDQTIWDGGNIHARKAMVRSGSDIDKHQLDINMYAVNDRINQLFFGILLLDEQLKQNRLLQDELKRTHSQVSAYLANGTANQADLDAVKVEQLNSSQKQTEMEATRKAYYEMLSAMINEKVDEANKPVKPEHVPQPSTGEIKRPELNLYQSQDYQLDARKKELQAQNMPKLGLFVQGAFGNPGLNMLKNEFSPYYMAGVRLSWNFGNLYTKRTQSKQIELSRSDINVQRQTFLFNTRLEITQSNNEIGKLVRLMEDDDEIISLRINIRKSAEAKVANGTLTVTEMLREITSENLAMQTKALHDIQLLMAVYKLKNTTNN